RRHIEDLRESGKLETCDRRDPKRRCRRCCVEIPSVETATYDLIHIYSIPNKDNLTIIPKSKYLVLGKGEYTYIDEDCRSITEDVHICKQLLLKSLQDAGDCITATIEHKINHESCPYAKMMIKKGKLQNISPSSWLLITNTQEV
ncbi:uncharacterized protein LOC131854528, partial [Achroia grisella]|uniref:uncharacterized protein LOC131854528 n=1 Tax=Achroia grisella TaxID=688607 RepID=UPI0027D34949